MVKAAILSSLALLAVPSSALARCHADHRSGWDMGFEWLALDGARSPGIGLEVVPLQAIVDRSAAAAGCVPASSLSLGLGARLTWFEDASFLGVHGLVEQAFMLDDRWQLSMQGRLGVFAARSTLGVAGPQSRFTWGPQLGGGLELRLLVLEGRMYVGLRADLRLGTEWVRPIDAVPLSFVALAGLLGFGGTW